MSFTSQGNVPDMCFLANPLVCNSMLDGVKVFIDWHPAVQ